MRIIVSMQTRRFDLMAGNKKPITYRDVTLGLAYSLFAFSRRVINEIKKKFFLIFNEKSDDSFDTFT